MELGKLKSPLLPVVMEIPAGKIEMQLDADIITGELMENARKLAEGDPNGVLSEEVRQVRFMSEVLSKLIAKWSVTDKGNEVKPSAEFFMKQPLKLVTDIYSFCMGELNPKKSIETT